MDFGHTGFKVPDEGEFLPIPVTPAKDIPTRPHQPSTVLETHPGRSNWSQFGGFSVPEASNGASLDQNTRVQASTSNGVSGASSCVVNSKGFVDHHKTSFNYSNGVVSKDQNKFPQTSSSNGLSGTLVASKGSMNQNKFLETLASSGLSGTLVASKDSVEQKNRFSNFSEASPSNGVVACLTSKGYGDQNSKINCFPVASTSNGAISCLNLMDSLDQNSRFNNWDTIMARGNLIANRIAESHTEALRRINAASNSTVLNLSSIASQIASTGYSSGIERGGNNGGSRSLCTVPFHQINGNQQVLQTTAFAKQGGNNNVVSSPLLSISHPPNQGNQQQVHSESHAVLLANHNSNMWTSSCEAQRSHLLKESTKNLAPLTPDHAKNKQTQNSEIRNGIDLSEVRNSIDHREDEKKGEQQIVVAHKMDEGIQHPQAKTFSESVVDSSVLSTPLKENSSSAKRLDYVIDLNLTPEQKLEQKPKRKKHRPKVVIEGVPKKTPNPVPSKEGSLKEKPPVKRKYVRRKALKAPTTPAAAELTETNCPTEGNNIIKTRQALKFECENQASKENAVIALNDQEQQAPGSVDSSFCRPEYNFNHQSQDLSNRVNNSKRKYVRRKKLKASNTPAAAEVTETNIPTAETTIKETRRALNFDNENQASQENAVTLNDQEQQPPCRVESSLCPPEYNFNHLSHDLSNRVNHGNRTKSMLELTQGLQVVEEHSPAVLPFDLNSPSSQMLRDSVSFPVKSAPTALPPNEKKELCCEHNNMNNETQLQSTNLVGAQYDSLQVYQNIFGLNLYCQNKNNLDLQFPKSCKRKRTETGQIKRIARTFSSKTTINDSVEIAMPFRESDSRSNNFTSQGCGGASKLQSDNIWDTTNRSQPNCYSHSKNSGYSPHEENASENLPSLKMHSRSTDQRQQQSKIMLSLGKPIWKKKKRSNRPTRVRDVASLIALVSCKQCPAATPKRVPTEIIHGGQSCIETLLLKSHATIPKKPRTRIARRVQSLSYSRQKVFYLKRYEATFNHYRRLLAKSAAHEHNALVPYRGDSRIVPYGETYGREQKSRPKVNLDPESARVFKLLMDGTEGLDETNGDKESWWREEREVFKGRVGSFIARMHMVQGDRRYLRWKGSVVDSVIGVFLTQNVTDHFSSSAFMSLAARYPLQPSSNHQECYQLWPNRCIEQPEVGIQDSNDPIIWNPEVSSQSISDQNGLDNSTELVQSYMGGSGLACNTRVKQYPLYETKSTKTEKAKLVGDDYVKALVDVVSSQDSALSPVNSTDSPLHPIERIGSSSDSNSGAEDLSLRDSSSTLNAITSFMDLLNASRDTLLQEYYSDASDASGRVLGNTQPKGLEFNNGKSSICSTDMPEGTYESIYPSITQTPLAQVTDIRSSDSTLLDVDDQLISGEGSRFSLVSTVSESADIKEVNCTSRRFCQLVDYPPEATAQNKMASRTKAAAIDISYNLPIVHSDHPLISSKQEANLEKKPECSKNIHMERIETFIPDDTPTAEPQNHVESLAHKRIGKMQQNPSHLPKFSDDALDVGESMFPVNEKNGIDDKNFELQLSEKVHSGDTAFNETNNRNSKANGKIGKEKLANFDWDSLRKEVHRKGIKRERNSNSRDSLDYEAVRCADVNEIANAIKARGMNNMLAERIKDFLNRLVKEHESIDLEWLRDVPPEKAKDFLLSIRGLGLKSVECVRLLTLHHHAFPVDTNVARIAVRLGWVPLQPLPEDLQIHLLELYPMLESVQKYLWPRLCTLDQKTLYELHYQMITFGKVFCTKRAPNCNACPMRAECRHFASAFASAKLALPGPEEKRLVPSTVTVAGDCNSDMHTIPTSLPLPEVNLLTGSSRNGKQEPIIEEPTSPEPYHSEITVQDIEDAFYEDPDEIPTINLSMEEFALNLQKYVQQNNVGLQEGDLSKALVALSPEAASIPLPKLKTVTRLRTEHQVYRLPDEHPLLREMERREPDDPCYYLLAIWTPGETAESLQEERCCSSDGSSDLYNNNACDNIQEENSQIVKGTILIPSKTAMRGSFPLNGTYFQVNEVFADHKTSLNPITVPRDWIWNLERRTVFFGTSVTAIFRGLPTEAIQSCFWRGYVCVRGFDQKSRAPRPLARRFHIAASKLPRGANGRDDM